MSNEPLTREQVEQMADDIDRWTAYLSQPIHLYLQKLTQHDAALRAERDEYKRKYEEVNQESHEKSENYRQKVEWCARLVRERDALKAHLDDVYKALNVSPMSSRPVSCYVTDLTRKLAESEKAAYDVHNTIDFLKAKLAEAPHRGHMGKENAPVTEHSGLGNDRTIISGTMLPLPY